MSLPIGYRPVDCFGPSASVRHVSKAELLEAGIEPAEALTLYYAQAFYAVRGDPRVFAYQRVIAAKVVDGEPLMRHEADWIAAQRCRLDQETLARKGIAWVLRWRGSEMIARIAPWRSELIEDQRVRFPRTGEDAP